MTTFRLTSHATNMGRGAAVATLLSVAVGIAACGGSAASALVTDCMTSPAKYLERTEGQPRLHFSLDLEVSCTPKRPFQFSEVEASVDSSVIGIEAGGLNTCLHREFKARREKCSIELFFESNKPPGPYDTFLTFQYAGETLTYITRVAGYIAKQR